MQEREARTILSGVPPLKPFFPMLGRNGFCVSKHWNRVAYFRSMISKVWNGEGVFNIEQMDPDPFMNLLNTCGLPWKIIDGPVIDLG